MYRVVISAALVAQALHGQTPASAKSSAATSSAPGYVAASAEPEPALAKAQALIDAGALGEAEMVVRRFLEDRAAAADAQSLLGYILFRQGHAARSLAAYEVGAKLRPLGALDLLVVGCDHMLLEDYSAAGAWFAKAIAMDAKNPLAFYYLGRVRYNEKHFEEAIHAFEECLRLDPANVKAQDNLGLALEALGKRDEALKAYRAAIAANAGSEAGPYLDLGNLLNTQGQPAEAVPYLLQAVHLAGRDPRMHQALAKSYLALHQLEKAQAEAESAVALAPQNAPDHFLLMQIYRQRGLREKASAESDSYSALTGTHSAPDSPLAGARSLLSLGKLKEAEQTTRDFLKTRSSSADGHYLLGYILFKEQQARESLQEYSEAAKYRTPTAEDLEAVASDYVLLKDYANADRWFTKAVTWNPKDALGWYYLGRTKYQLNRFEEAIAAFRETLKLEPRNVKAADNLGLCYEGLNRTDEAAGAYRDAIAWQMESALKDAGPFLNLGSLCMNLSREQEALPYLLQAVHLAPRDYRAHRQLGKAYMHLNELDKARAALETAAQLAPENAPVHFMLGQVYRKQGLLDQAKAENNRYAALVESGSEK